MTKKTTINKIVSSKAFWIIISLLASFLLWTYICLLYTSDAADE